MNCIQLSCAVCCHSCIWLYAVSCFCVISISSVGGSAQECMESITLLLVPLDVLCDVVGIFEHVKELQCLDFTNPLEVCQPYASLCALSLLHPCHTCTQLDYIEISKDHLFLFFNSGFKYRTCQSRASIECNQLCKSISCHRKYGFCCRVSMLMVCDVAIKVLSIHII